MPLYEPRPQFLPFHYRNQRWACMVAHRRAGKTVACVNDLLTRGIATSKKEGRYAYIAPFYNQAKGLAWDYIKKYGQEVITKVSESDLQVELFNGSRIRLFGADNPDSLRGLYLDGCILDEFGDMRAGVWGPVIRPMLADRKGWAVFIGTPKGHNEFYKIWTDSQEQESWFSFKLRASESGILPPDELLDARKIQSEDEYEREFECSFEAAILGAVYGKSLSQIEKDGRVKHDIYDRALPVHTAWDLGYDDATAIWFWQSLHNEVRLIDYYEANGQDIEHYCDVLRKRAYRYGSHFVPHDAAHKLLAAGGRSIVQQAYAHGVKMRVVAATSQQNSIEAARKTLEVSWFDPICKEGIEALKQYQFEWDEEKKVFRSKPRHDWTSHAADAFEIIGQVWRNPKVEAIKPKPRFLNEMTFDELIKSTNNSRDERI